MNLFTDKQVETFVEQQLSSPPNTNELPIGEYCFAQEHVKTVLSNVSQSFDHISFLTQKAK